MNPNIFRAYDIRGNANKDFDPSTVNKIGYVLGKRISFLGDSKVYVGNDSRTSKDEILKNLTIGLNAAGIAVISLGLVPTPMVYYATKIGDCSHGIMITGSHNPKDDNGLKIVINDAPTSGLAIKDEVFALDSIELKTCNNSSGSFEKDYLNEVKKKASLKRALKIVLDAGNGAAGPLARKVFENIGAEVISINETPDGNFPNHHPDPSKEKNLAQVKEKILVENADLGFAFDGDGDRVGLITSTGKQISSDHIIMILCEYYLKKLKGPIVYDVKCSNELPKLIKNLGGEPLMEKTGHFNIKNAIKKSGAVLGGEMSGHIFINYEWYGFDDAIFTAAILSKIFSESRLNVDELFDKFPKTFSTPELNLDVDDSKKFLMVEQFIKKMNFKNAEIDLTDGVRVNKANSWGLLRASNTSPKFVLRYEGNSEEELMNIKDEFESNLKQVFPNLPIEYS